MKPRRATPDRVPPLPAAARSVPDYDDPLQRLPAALQQAAADALAEPPAHRAEALRALAAAHPEHAPALHRLEADFAATERLLRDSFPGDDDPQGQTVRLPHEVVAGCMGQSEEAVRELLVRALLALAEQLRARGVELT
jgi:hypothetical protein